ncbi:MAG: RNA-binding transcriptional accessory protein, partial [Oscillospiraceae bacterium]
DIIAEMISDNATVRNALRTLFWREALVTSEKIEASKDEKGTYTTYYEFGEAISKIAGYKILALDRGEKEKILKVSISCPRELIFGAAASLILKKGFSLTIETVKIALEDSLTRLIVPSMEREIRSDLTEKAAAGAIKVFGLNLKPLLMQPPVKGKVALGFDPGYRTGCKVAVVDGTGKVLDTGVVYPTMPRNDILGAGKKIKELITKHKVEIIAIGNGTASKESEIFISDLIKEIPFSVSYMVVSEAGASVYSASKLAADEFPEYDVSLRSAVSIARRLQDPLAELVKIDPKAIGVGQYQHDMPKAQLDDTLKGVVEDCVNTVGVDVNTASFSLLSYI